MSEKIDCPVDGCDYSGNNRGLGIHASHEHPDMDIDTSSEKKYTCGYCGDSFTDYPSRRETRGRKNFFCSRKCKDNFSSKDGLDTECSECDKEIHIPKSRMDEVNGYEQKNYFCSKECESSFKSREWVNEDHPSWDGGREQVYCEECGERYLVPPHRSEESRFCSQECFYESWSVEVEKYQCKNCDTVVERKPYNVKGDVVVCSNECFSEFMRSIRRVEDNPQWKGGISGAVGDPLRPELVRTARKSSRTR
jgi:YHS domain-containing protein